MTDDERDDNISTGCPPGMPWWEPWCECGACNDRCPVCDEAVCRAGCPHACEAAP